MKTLIAVMLCCLAQQVPTGGQSQQTPTFRVAADLLTLTVTVVDSDGRPIAGLLPSDFQVTVAGKPATVSVAEFIGLSGGTRSLGASGTPGTGAGGNSRSGSTASDRRTVLLLFDDLSYTSEEALEVKGTLPRLLTALDPSDLVGFATTSGLGSAIAPTTERLPVLEALRKVDGRQIVANGMLFIGIDEALEIDRGFPRDTLTRVAGRECGYIAIGPGCDEFVAGQARQIAADARRRLSGQNDALRRAVAVMGDLGAPRVIVLLSKGVAGEAEPERRRAVLDDLQVTAALAGIQFYALAISGDDQNMRDVGPDRSKARSVSQRVYLDGLKSVAAAAGGDAFGVIGQPDRFFERIARETSGVYRLGVESAATREGSTIAIEVKVGRRGVSVKSVGRTRTSSMAAAPAAPSSLEEVFRRGQSVSGLPISVGTVTRRLSSDQIEVIAEVRSSSQRPPLRLMFGLVDEQGGVVVAGQKSLDANSLTAGRWLFPLRVRPGKFQVRAAGADDGGTFGLAQEQVDGLGEGGGVTWSDVLVSAQTESGRLPLVSVMPSGATATAQIELYVPGTAWPGAMTVKFVMTTAGGTTGLFESERLPLQMEGQTGTAEIQLPDLFGSEASVVVAAIIYVDGKEVGRKSRLLSRLR